MHPDEIFFECFSRDESTYGRLSCDHETFKRIGEISYGTTNIDYSHALYDEFQKIRSYRTTSLAIDPKGFDVQTTGEEAYREEKIDLPDSWVRGFLQVSSAMALPAHVVELHPMDMHSILARLAMRKERHGPRSLRFFLEPDKPVRVLIEPWGEVLEFRRSIYKGTTGAEIRLWGRRRLAILARALPLAKSVRLHLLGTGLPSFAVVDYGGLRFTLGLSGWTSNDWSRAGQFDLLAPRREVDEVTAQRVFDALKAAIPPMLRASPPQPPWTARSLPPLSRPTPRPAASCTTWTSRSSACGNWRASRCPWERCASPRRRRRKRTASSPRTSSPSPRWRSATDAGLSTARCSTTPSPTNP